MARIAPVSAPQFLQSRQPIGPEIARTDWANTPVGDPLGWPEGIKSLLATWLDSPQAMFLAWGADLRFLFNEAYRPFLGARGSSAVGQPFKDVWPDVWPDIEPLVKKALQGEATRLEDLPLTMTRNGYPEQTWWTFTYMPVRASDGQVIGMMGISVDTTARVEAELQLRTFNETLENKVAERTAELSAAMDSLRQAQKLEALGQLTGGVAHDFNNLMSVVGTSVQLMLRKELPEPTRRKYLETIHETVQRASKLTGQLLAFARQQPLRPEVFDVGLQAEHVVELIKPLVGSLVRMEFLKAPEPCYALADINQFETSLMNLALNARDAVGEHGGFSIRVACSSPPGGVPGDPAQGQVAIIVSDSGAGIAPEKLDLIFEPFYTTKEVGKGTGLGLSQVIGFARQSGGDVTVRSTLGQGATFTLYLPQAAPVVRETLLPSPPPGENPPQAPRPARVLVVEDNALVGRMTVAAIEDIGYLPTLASDAAQALQLLGQDGQPFDVVFSDIVMPGMNGVELAKTIRQRHAALPVVLTSGYSDLFAEKIPKDLQLVQKPFTVDTLARALQTALNQQPALRSSP